MSPPHKCTTPLAEPIYLYVYADKYVEKRWVQALVQISVDACRRVQMSADKVQMSVDKVQISADSIYTP